MITFSECETALIILLLVVLRWSFEEEFSLDRRRSKRLPSFLSRLLVAFVNEKKLVQGRPRCEGEPGEECDNGSPLLSVLLLSDRGS